MVVAIHVPQRLEARLRGISQAFQEYKQLKLLKNPIKGIYILLFLLMTLIIVFSATWFGLYLARGITDPIQMLAEGTREVAAGNLKYKVQVRADDEIGILVDSFNRMTGDLAASQAKLEETYRDLQAKHTEMEQRRRYTETVLEAVATGVVSLDAAGRITTINGAAERLLGLPAAEILASRRRARVPPARVRGDRRAHPAHGPAARGHGRPRGAPPARRAGGGAARLRHRAARAATAATWAWCWSSTTSPSCSRPSAWPRGARSPSASRTRSRTRSRPIQLSAQRLRRRLSADRSPDEKRLLEEATATIIQEVDGLKQLVDEFSRFARMPALTPKPTDLGAAPRGRGGALPRVASRAVHPRGVLARPAAASTSTPTSSSARSSTWSTTPSRPWAGTGEVAVETVWLPEAHRARIVVSRRRARHRRPRTRSASSCPTSRRRPPAWASACPSSTRS